MNDPERLARFQREAKVLASLNHPNIAAIYGIEGTEGAHAEEIEHEAVDREKALRVRGGYEFVARVAATASVGQRGNELLSWNRAALHRGLA